MITFILRRLISLLPIVLLVSILVFVAVRLIPGDPVDVIYGREERVSAETRSVLEKKLGLDQPLPLQYLLWLSRFLRGDWGVSYSKSQPVAELVLEKIPWTLLLAISSLIIAILVATPLGIYTATHYNTLSDHFIMGLVLIAQSIPNFWLGILLILFCSLKWRWLPSFGAVSPTENAIEALRHLIMPSFTLGVGVICILIRLIRTSILDELKKDYVRTAIAKGITNHEIIFRHVLRNALIPSVTVIGLWFGSVMSGSVIVESIFAWPGLGLLLFQSILNRDYPVVQSVVLVIAITFVSINLVVDILYTILDPRIQLLQRRAT